MVAVLMGLLTGVAGGMVRDVLARRVPMVLREEVYATASIAGGIAYVGLGALGVPAGVAIGLALVVTLGLRLAAIYWGLALPVFAWVVIPPPAPLPAAVENESPEESDSRRQVDQPRVRPKVRVRMISPKQRRGRQNKDGSGR